MVVYRVCRGWLERKDQWGWLELMDQEVAKGLQVFLDSGVLLGLLEMLHMQDILGFKDHQGYQGTQGVPALKGQQVTLEESSTQLDPLLSASQVFPVLLDVQDHQVQLALLVCLANLVLKVTEDLGASRENKE